ncbi:uncharacterized protein LOC117115231 [Anneissia japonica]|uniref:uncharacterized protein LOC117115231 n=1 Tax=Anneissia japonica TaxID=1529436 RepID=UPI0014259FE0|nr:uncharacterized protein LOC117115231 [Anneissia japonica]XP_033114834.1 uncharacterized protein LOC117115231 [Anneissia japonica]
MATRYFGISDEDFRQLLVKVSEWYDARGYINMLKVLYRDHVTEVSQLQNASQTMTLLHLLYDSGDLCPTDLTLLYESIKATQKYGLIQEIKALIPSCPNIREVVISKFTPYRQKLMKLGFRLVQTDVGKISALYNNPVKAYADSWSLINDLEHRMIICEKNMKNFIKKLEKNNFHQAVAALREDIGNAPQEDQAPKECTEYGNAPPKNKRKRKDQAPTEEYDFYIISEDMEWEKRMLYELQKKMPGVKCLSRKDWKYGKFKIDNLVSPVKRCKRVVVGFTSGMAAGNLEFVAVTAVQQMLDDNSLDQGKLIPVRITEDAMIPVYLETITVANGWEEDFYDRLLNALTEQEIKVVLRCNESMEAGHSLRPDDPMSSSNEPKEKVQNQPIDIPFKSNKVLEHFRHLGISRVDGVTSEPSSLCLLTNDPKVLTKLWSEYQNGRLMEDLRKILSIDNYQGDLSQMWSLYIDKTKYTEALQNMESKDKEDGPAAKIPNVGRPFDQDEKMYSVDNNLLPLNVVKRKKEIELPQSCTVLDLSNFIKNVQQKGISLTCTTFIARSVNLSSITGKTLFTLFKIAPNLIELELIGCNLSSNIVDDLISRYLDDGSCVLKSLTLSINDLSNIDTKRLSTFASTLNTLKLDRCKVPAVFFKELVSNSLEKLRFFFVINNDFSDIKGTTLCSLFKAAPFLDHLDFQSINLSSKIVNEMVEECWDSKMTLSLIYFNISKNDLHEVKGCNLDKLLKMSPVLFGLEMEECKLTGNIVNEMVIQNEQHNRLVELNLSLNNLHDIDVNFFASISCKFPKIRIFNISNCELNDNKLDAMMKCKGADAVLKEGVLQL